MCLTQYTAGLLSELKSHSPYCGVEWVEIPRRGKRKRNVGKERGKEEGIEDVRDGEQKAGGGRKEEVREGRRERGKCKGGKEKGRKRGRGREEMKEGERGEGAQRKGRGRMRGIQYSIQLPLGHN